jgi:hypothetical protein
MNRKSFAVACLALILAGCTYAGYQRDYVAGFGPGLIGPGAVYGPMYYDPAPKPITQDEALAMVNNYLATLRNPNLRPGKPVNQGDSYQIPIRTLDGSLVDIFVIDKFSGWIKSIYK